MKLMSSNHRGGPTADNSPRATGGSGTDDASSPCSRRATSTRDGAYYWSGSFQIDKGPLPDYVEMSVNGSPVIAETPFLDKAERNTLYAGEIGDNFRSHHGASLSASGATTQRAPSYASDVQTFEADPCEEA